MDIFLFVGILGWAAAAAVPMAFMLRSRAILCVVVAIATLIMVLNTEKSLGIAYCASLVLFASFGYWFRDLNWWRHQIDDALRLSFDDNDEEIPAKEPTTPFGTVIWHWYSEADILTLDQCRPRHLKILKKLLSTRGLPRRKLARARASITRKYAELPIFLLVADSNYPHIQKDQPTLTAVQMDEAFQEISKACDELKIPSKVELGQLALKDQQWIFIGFLKFLAFWFQ